jgi:hypothetical protein
VIFAGPSDLLQVGIFLDVSLQFELNSEARQVANDVTAQEAPIYIVGGIDNCFQTTENLDQGLIKRRSDGHYREDIGGSTEYPGYCDEGDKTRWHK